jgi:mannose-P-dolichol utilization defect 1
MSTLLSLPFVPELAQYIWGSFQVGDDQTLPSSATLSPEYCLSNFLWDGPCFGRLAVKALGVGMITGAFLNKAPILANIISTQSVAGLPKSSMYGEVIVLTNGFLYGYLEGLPFTAYGENFALLLQSIAIVLLIWKFSKASIKEQALGALIWCAYLYFIIMILSDDYNSMLMRSLLPIVIYAKGSQIQTIFLEKHTGNQSVITLSMNCIGTTVRIGTTIAEVGWDLDLLAGHAIGAALNYTLLLQYWLYRENTRCFWESQSSKRDKVE